MRIIAESRPAAAMPFIHLGYLAASYVKPQGGLLLTGSILAVASIGMALRFVTGRNRAGRTRTEVALRKSRMGALGAGLLLVGVGCVFLAWKTARIHYPHGDMMTSINMQHVMRLIDMKVNNTPDEFTKEHGNAIKALPTKAGEYDLATAVQNTEDKDTFTDGWEVPMRLKVIVTPDQKPDYILISAGEDRQWNTEDDVTSLKYADTWPVYK